MKKINFSQDQLLFIKLRSNNKCFYCGRDLEDNFEIENSINELHVAYDHIAVCKNCKNIKNGMTIEQFRNYIIDIVNDLENNPIYSLLFGIGQIKRTENLIKFYGEKISEQTKSDEIIIDNIKKQVSLYFELKEEDIDINTRRQDVVWPRQIAHYFSYKKTKLSLRLIGLKIGKKDHATVLHGVKTVEREIETNKDKKRQVEYLTKIFNLQE